MLDRLLTPELQNLRELFVKNGRDLRFVGGCVRDSLLGITPKDIDLCTDADPAEQIELYRQVGVSYHETGIAHGTITVVLSGVPYEITSLRRDVETDGRRATVAYTRDWIADLERRDFTINAMSLTFDGELIDPFNGLDDLGKGLVAFVGDAETRIREDHLRILRWFRFRGRFGMSQSFSAQRAVKKLAEGLEAISRERVWSEVKRIISGPNGPYLMLEMHQMGVAEPIDLPVELDYIIDTQQISEITSNPVALMVSMYDMQAESILREWKASSDEIKLAVWLYHWQFKQPDRHLMTLLAVDGAPREWVLELAALRLMDEFERGVLACWEIPVFPVGGNDLLERGFKQDHYLGQTLKQLKELWADSGYTLTKPELLAHLGSLV